MRFVFETIRFISLNIVRKFLAVIVRNSLRVDQWALKTDRSFELSRSIMYNTIK